MGDFGGVEKVRICRDDDGKSERDPILHGEPHHTIHARTDKSRNPCKNSFFMIGLQKHQIIAFFWIGATYYETTMTSTKPVHLLDCLFVSYITCFCITGATMNREQHPHVSFEAVLLLGSTVIRCLPLIFHHATLPAT